jgi:hypothetical protein
LASPRAVVLLGAQRFDTTLGTEVRRLEVDGPVAVITAGWQERESEDEELKDHLGNPTVNLKLYERAEKCFAADPELQKSHRARQIKLRHKQDFYRVRLEHELDANHVIRQRSAPDDVLEEEEEASVAAIRALDEYHLAQCERVHEEYERALDPAGREVVQEHREELAEILRGCVAIAIAGGHVVSMLNRLRLFAVREMIDEQHVVFAWSGGGMTVTDTVVLFHDNPPQGPGASEVLDRGLGLVNDVVMLPHPETRLRLDDPERVSVLARRFAPADCFAFAAGGSATFRGGRIERPSSVIRMRADGKASPLRASKERRR